MLLPGDPAVEAAQRTLASTMSHSRYSCTPSRDLHGLAAAVSRADRLPSRGPGSRPRNTSARGERRGRHPSAARPTPADCLRPSLGWRAAGLLRDPRRRARRALRPPGQGGLVRSCRRRSGHYLVRRPSRSRSAACRSGFADSGEPAECSHRHRLPAHRPTQRCRACCGCRPGCRRAGRTPAQAPGPPHLSGQPRLSERAHHGHVRACRDGHGAARHPAASG